MEPIWACVTIVSAMYFVYAYTGCIVRAVLDRISNLSQENEAALAGASRAAISPILCPLRATYMVELDVQRSHGRLPSLSSLSLPSLYFLIESRNHHAGVVRTDVGWIP